jgi:hypothetical protein
MMTINLSDAQEAALAARAAAEGLSLQQWLENLAEEVPADVPSAIDPPAHSPKRPIWDVIADRAQALPAEVIERLPEDGASQHDHYSYGLLKREL